MLQASYTGGPWGDAVPKTVNTDLDLPKRIDMFYTTWLTVSVVILY